MEPFPHHIYICTQQKAEGAPSCSAHGSAEVLAALRRELAEQGLADQVQVTTCGSLGLCDRGPNMVIYPEGTWYSGVRPGDAAEIVRDHLAAGRVVERLLSGSPEAVRAQIDANRARMLAALRAQEEAGVLPDELGRAVNGFRESRVLLTAIELDLFSAVGDGADAAAVARTLRTDLRATESLLNALAALGVLHKRDGTFRNSPEAARFLAQGGEHDARAALLHTVHLWSRWSTLTECLRAGTSVARATAQGPEAGWTDAFIAAMHRNAAFRAPVVARAIGLEGVRRVLDLGGGSGAYSIAFAQAEPGLSADILDLAAVVPIAQRHIDEAGLADHVHARVGNIADDRYGEDYDLVFLSAICHMNGPQENRAMLARVHAALAPGGRVAIQDFILNPDRAGPKTGALFALNMLVGTRAGGTYNEAEYAAWLGDVGFGEIRRLPLPGPTDLIVARKS